MSVDVDSKILKNKPSFSVDAEADKKIEQGLLFLKRGLNKLVDKLGDKLAALVINVTSYNFIPAIVCSVIFSYIALSEDVRVRVRRLIPSYFREMVVGSYSVVEITVIVAIVGIVLAAWLFSTNVVSDIVLKRQNRKLRAANTDLQSKNTGMSIDCYDLFSKYLYSISRKYGYGSSERISLYVLDLEFFRCIGRHSNDEKYRARPNKMYPKEQGFIGKAWRVGGVTTSDLPDPNVDLDAWVNSNTSSVNISQDTLAQIGMKSRAFHCVRIINSKSASVAVIVFESSSGKLPNSETILADFGKDEIRTVANLLDALRLHMVKLEFAKREGF